MHTRYHIAFGATALAVLFVLFSLPVIAHAQLDDAFVKDTDIYLSRLQKLGFAGSVMIVVDGKEMLASGYGDAKRDPSVKWTTGTVSTIGSITKQFTAAAIMRLQEQGKLDVYDTLDKHFTDVPADKAGITLHHLLSHSSGIIDPPDFDDYDENTRDGYVHVVLDAPLNSEPGTTFEYANANFSLLGAIIEQETGKNYEAALRDLVFEPAGLQLTGYQTPDYSKVVVADGYQGDERWGNIVERPMAADGPYWALRANGGIQSTAEEMIKWGQALLDNRVLSADSRDAMWTPQIDESNNDEGQSFYAYGWAVMEPAPGVKVITHNGGNGILFADMAIVPTSKMVLFVQTNVISNFRATNGLLEQVMMRTTGEPYPQVPNVVDVEPGSLDRWAGTYAIGDDTIEVAADGNALSVTPHGWRAHAAVHSLPGQEIEPLLEMSADVDRIVGAFLAGDYQPLHDAYQGRVPIDELEQIYKERLAMRESEYGKLQGYDVLGTGTGREFHFTIVRYRYEREPIERTYVWSREEAGTLVGVTHRSMSQTARFYPVEGGGYQSWDPSTGASVHAKLKGDAGDAQFVVARDAGDVVLKQ